jgi:K+-transporting ATPase KdpF subunit
VRPRGRASVSARGAARAVSIENVIGLVLAVAVLAFLVYALLAPERLG